ncbi:hypothetical protein TNCT_73981 [Trichonephila clavata]|uniref:Uncharacterized protein n=1 Tax=Trichonephila clavata TaxID=2740835 RepID=A0A8X6F4A3_TRICU|nr:hypothetical protein TNCT_73981 [Trichonephila clavata]
MRLPSKSYNPENRRSRVESSKAESRKNSGAMSGSSSSYPLRNRVGNTERQAMLIRISPYLSRSRAESRRQGE